jgi:hypothetical protein
MSFTFEQVKEVLKIHEESLTRFFMTHVDKLERKVDEVRQENVLLKKRMEEVEKYTEVSSDIIEEKIKELELNKTDENRAITSNMLENIQAKVSDLEDRSRRNNLRVGGITECNGETWEQTEEKLKKMIQDTLGISSHDVEVERAHRTGLKKNRDGTVNKKRTIVAKFLNYKTKTEILSKYKEKQLWKQNIFINDDFSEATNLKRKRLFAKGKMEKENGRCYSYKVNYDKLFLKDSEGGGWRFSC